jgi:hypothetical protein
MDNILESILNERQNNNHKFVLVPSIEDLKISVEKGNWDIEGTKYTLYKPDLRYCIEGESFGLHISDCDFSRHYFDVLFFELLKLTVIKLKVLYIARTQLASFNAVNFPDLEYLYLAENDKLFEINLQNTSNLHTLSANINPKLTKITNLSLGNAIKNVDLDKEMLDKLQNQQEDGVKSLGIPYCELLGLAVTYIFYGNSGLEMLPEHLFQFQALESLNLGELHYTDGDINNPIPIGTKDLNNFSMENSINGLEKFDKLKFLSLNYCKLRKLDFLKGLKDLEFLDLSGNAEILAEQWQFVNNTLTKLNGLDLRTCNLNDKILNKIEFSNAKNLELFNLSSNYLKSMEFLEKLPNSTKVILNHNELTTQSILEFIFGKEESTGKLNSKRVKSISANPLLVKSINIFGNPIDEGLLVNFFENYDENEQELNIKNYYKRYQSDTFLDYKHAKIMLLGNTTVGKTTLRQILLGQEVKDEKSTHGVKVFNQNVNGTFVQLFDFGGQDYYHSFHLSFYSQNPVSILTYGISGNQNEESFDPYKYGSANVEGLEEILFPIDYWTGGILEKTVGKSKVYYFQNYRDQKNIKYLNYYELQNNEKLELIGFENFNFLAEQKELKGILDKVIKDKSITSQTLKKDLDLGKRIVKGTKVIYSIQEIKSISNLAEDEHVLSLLKSLEAHRFGILLERQEYELKESVFIGRIDLFSDWVHEILKKDLFEDGYFDETEAIRAIGSKEGKVNVHIILQFLKNHYVIFEILPYGAKENLKFVAPSYLKSKLSKAEKILLSNFSKPISVFTFSGFFHSNILLMLIKEFKSALLFDDIKKEFLMWKNIVLLHDGDKDIPVLSISLKYPEKPDEFPKIELRINEKVFDAKHTLLKKVFKFIYDNVNKYNPKVMVQALNGELVPFTALQANYSDKNFKTFNIYHNQKVYSVYDFRRFYDFEDTPPKIFIGYSKFDEPMVDEFLKHMKPYEKKEKISVFYDRDMSIEKWDARLETELKNSDVLVCFVSSNMLCTEYVMEKEIEIAKDYKVSIFPIIIEECNWHENDFRNYDNFLDDYNGFDKGKPLPSSKYERAPYWTKIAKLLTTYKNGTLNASSSKSSERKESLSNENEKVETDI